MTKAGYDRVASVYDVVEGWMEGKLRRFRILLWERVRGDKLLEIGVGTGRNLPFYPQGAQVVAIDLSQKMLTRACSRAASLKMSPQLLPMDVQRMAFADSSFDAVVGSFVFCAVADPALGLAEVKRVCRPGGQVLLLEHVLPENGWPRRLLNAINPITVRLMDEHVNRDTVSYVNQSGLRVNRVTSFAGGIIKLIEAEKPDRPA